jgi:hypothetical protein
MAPEWNLQDPRLVTELWLEQCIAFDEICEDHPDSLRSKTPLRIRLPNESKSHYDPPNELEYWC